MLSAPTLFMNAEREATRVEREVTWAVSARPVLENQRPSTSTMPELRNTSLRTSTAATVITAGWLKPRKASEGGTMPTTVRMTRAASATMS